MERNVPCTRCCGARCSSCLAAGQVLWRFFSSRNIIFMYSSPSYPLAFSLSSSFYFETLSAYTFSSRITLLGSGCEGLEKVGSEGGKGNVGGCEYRNRGSLFPSPPSAHTRTHTTTPPPPHQHPTSSPPPQQKKNQNKHQNEKKASTASLPTCLRRNLVVGALRYLGPRSKKTTCCAEVRLDWLCGGVSRVR